VIRHAIVFAIAATIGCLAAIFLTRFLGSFLRRRPRRADDATTPRCS
jgi:hypothetical protein